jgi:inner membrane protein
MDPFTQGVLGAALPQAAARKPQIRVAGAFGFLAGMAADLDVFIRSATDPLAVLEYHRHFTHSLIFIPLGGLLCAGVFHALWGRRRAFSFWQTYLFCTLGYATHALLDAATSYGTMLFWPFSDARVSGSIVAVIDPLFTVPLAALVGVSAFKKNPLFARLGLAWGAFYLALATAQHFAALGMGREIAAARGHSPLRLEVKPSFGNILVWKTIYETAEDFHVDAVRAGIAPKVFEGVSLPKLNVARDFPWVDPASQQARDIERFSWFSQGFVARDPDRPHRVIDVRYSFVPNDIAALWSIELTEGAAPAAHAMYRTHRDDARQGLGVLWDMITK